MEFLLPVTSASKPCSAKVCICDCFETKGETDRVNDEDDEEEDEDEDDDEDDDDDAISISTRPGEIGRGEERNEVDEGA